MRIPQGVLHSTEGRLMQAAARVCEGASFDQCRYIGAWLGLLFHGALPMRRGVSTRNLRLAFPHLNPTQANRLARRASQNACMTFCEFLHLKNATEKELREYSWIEGKGFVEDGFRRGKGVILLTSHLGNWEVLGARAALEVPLTVIARPRSNAALHEHIESIRAHVNVHVISRFDTGRAPLKVLKANQTLGILPDQYEQGGPLLPFFGQPTRAVDALARLALLSGALVAPSFGIRQTPWLANGKILCRVTQPFEVKKSKDREAAVLQGTRQVLHELEKVIGEFPDQWLWMHRRWREKDGVVFPG